MNQDRALQYFNKGLSLEFNNAFILNNRGFLYLNKNDMPKALADINESMVINANNPLGLSK